jgi:hypothetical protein
VSSALFSARSAIQSEPPARQKQILKRKGRGIAAECNGSTIRPWT